MRIQKGKEFKESLLRCSGYTSAVRSDGMKDGISQLEFQKKSYLFTMHFFRSGYETLRLSDPLDFSGKQFLANLYLMGCDSLPKGSTIVYTLNGQTPAPGMTFHEMVYSKGFKKGKFFSGMSGGEITITDNRKKEIPIIGKNAVRFGEMSANAWVRVYNPKKALVYEAFQNLSGAGMFSKKERQKLSDELKKSNLPME